MSVLRVETTATRVLNSILLFLVTLEPYLSNILPLLGDPSQISNPLFSSASTYYALDIGAIYGILALFTSILATDERKLVAPDLLRKYKLNRDLDIIAAIIFFASAIPQFWSLSLLGASLGAPLRYYVWATTFFFNRGERVMRGFEKIVHRWMVIGTRRST